MMKKMIATFKTIQMPLPLRRGSSFSISPAWAAALTISTAARCRLPFLPPAAAR